MPDGHGCTRQLTAYTTDSTNGHVTARYDYDAFGGAIPIAGLPANTASTIILYSGQQWDLATGEYYLRSRYYTPTIGRFTGADAQQPSQDLADANRYAYVSEDPINLLDPTGADGLGELLVNIGIRLLNYSITAYNVFNKIRPIITVVAVIGTISDPQAAQDFLASGGNPVDLAESLFADAKALESELASLGREVESIAEDARLFKLLSPRVAVSSLPISDAQELTSLATFRSEVGLPATSTGNDTTIAKLRIGDTDFLGISAHGQPLSVTVNPISGSHAEIDALNQAKQTGVSATHATIYVDKPPCQACDDFNAIGSVARQIGIQTIEVIWPGGRYTMVTGTRG
jgi:RHS repeat-associated protein